MHGEKLHEIHRKKLEEMRKSGYGMILQDDILCGQLLRDRNYHTAENGHKDSAGHGPHEDAVALRRRHISWGRCGGGPEK